MKPFNKIVFQLIFLVGQFTLSKTAISQNYDFRNYNVEDGLTQSQVLSIAQDHQGNIWFGTNGGGLSKYNGNRFTTISTKDSLIDNVVFSITESKKHEMIFGTNAGLSVYNGFKFKNFTEKDGLVHNRVFNVFCDRSGTVWIGTGNGVCTYRNGELTKFSQDSTLNNSSVFTIYEDNGGNIWFGTIQNGAIKCKLSNNNYSFTYFSAANGLTANFVRSFTEDHLGNVFVGTIAGLVSIDPTNNISPITTIPRQENVAFITMTKDLYNNLWLGTDNGIYKLKNGKVEKVFLMKNGLPSNMVISSIQDREGNFWFGTDGFGTVKLSSETFTNYSTLDSLPGNYISSAFEDSKGNYWIGVKDHGVCKLGNGKIQQYKWTSKCSGNCIADNEVSDIEEGLDGKMYFATKEGLSVFDGKNFTNYYKKHGLPDNNIYSIYKDKNGFWLSTNGGICRFDGAAFYPIEEVNIFKGENDFPVFSIEKDRDGNLWLATEYGAIRYSPSGVKRFDASNGFISKRTVSVVRDLKGFLWFGTVDGLYHYDYKTFTLYNQSKGISSNKIYLLTIDKENHLWVGSTKGLDKINLNNFYRSGELAPKHYGKEEGLKGLECNLNASFKDSKGNIMIGTIKGLTVYNPRYDKQNTKEAITIITGLRLFFENADFSNYSSGTDSSSFLPSELVLPYDLNHITIDFVGVCITNPGKVKYQFKLEGLDKDWYPPTSKTEATYPALPPGKYTFHLKSMNNDGVWNETPVTFKFQVLPPWYNTWWFYSVCVILVVSIIYLYNDYKVKKLRSDNIKLEKTVDQRTKELREEKEKVELFNTEIVQQKGIIEAKNRDITDSIKYAKNIQEALLPSMQLLKKNFPESFVIYMPKDIVSGDFYWFANRGGKQFFASVDCTGHGVPGAFMSIIGNSLLNEIVAEQNILEPAVILDHLHLGVKSALNQNKGEFERRDGMDIALCSYDKNTGIIEYAGANRPLWIFRANQHENPWEVIKANKFPIGGLELEESRKYTNHKIKVNLNDTFYVFSDGYADQFGGEKGKKFMVGNMQKVIQSIYQKPLDEQKEILQNTFLNWRGEYEQIDDVLVIGVRV